MATLKSQLVLSLQDQVTGRMKAISAQMAAFQTRMRAISAPFTGMTARLAAVGGGYIGVTAGMRGTVGAAIGFESAMADIAKVLEVTDEQFANIRRQILGMSKVLPNSAEGIADIYANAAQANIPVRELGKFTEMVAKVAVAWDVTEGQTSEALAKIKTQLNMGVDQIGLYADAINHLSNNAALAAPDLVDFSKRVAAQGEFYGFAATESLAFGAAMISMGAQSEVAATSFRNMGKALAAASNATPKTQKAFKRLGLDYTKMSKRFKSDATGTMLDVFDRIQGLAEHEQFAVVSQIFGDEARALLPIINNTKELRRQIGLVGDETNYAGSAFAEYEQRAKTTENTLKLIRNNMRAIGIEIGDSMLPSIKAASDALLEVFKTLGDRVTPLKQLETAWKGFTKGLGYDGSIKSVVEDLSDLFLGKVDPSEGADRLGQLFVKMERWGKTVREFNDAVRDSPVAQFLGEIAGQGFKLFLAAAGFTMLAGALRKVAKAMLLLSGASAAIAIIKTLAGIGGAMLKMPSLPGGKPGGGSTTPKGKGGAPGAAGGGVFALLRQFAARIPHLLVAGGTAYGTHRFIEETTRDNAAGDAQSATHRRAERDSMAAYDRQRAEIEDMHEDRRAAKALRTGQAEPAVGFWNAPAGQALKGVWDSIKAWESGLADRTGLKVNTGQPDDLRSDLHSLRDAIHQPSGTQKVEVVNQQPPNINLGGVTVYATTNASPQEIANATAARVSAALESQFSNAHLA